MYPKPHLLIFPASKTNFDSALAWMVSTLSIFWVSTFFLKKISNLDRALAWFPCARLLSVRLAPPPCRAVPSTVSSWLLHLKVARGGGGWFIQSNAVNEEELMMSKRLCSEGDRRIVEACVLGYGEPRPLWSSSLIPSPRTRTPEWLLRGRGSFIERNPRGHTYKIEFAEAN